MNKQHINTRAALADAEKPYVGLVCQKLREKIESEWAEKWQKRGFGASLMDCKRQKRFNSFLKALKTDMAEFIRTEYPNAKTRPVEPSETTFERLLDSRQNPSFLQHKLKEILVLYLGEANWESFKTNYPMLSSSIEQTTTETGISNTVYEYGKFLPVLTENGWIVVVNDPHDEALMIEVELYIHFFAEKQDDNVPYQEVKKPWAWIGAMLLSFSLGIGIMIILTTNSPNTAVLPQLRMTNSEKMDTYGKDRVSILFTTQLVGLVELNAYRALPDIDSTWLDLCYTPESPSRKRIIDALKRRSITEWTMGNAENPSNFNVVYFKILKQTTDSAVVETKEQWHLKYWDLKKKNYSYQYDHEDEQIHYLVKINGRWKVYLVERKEENGKRIVDN